MPVSTVGSEILVNTATANNQTNHQVTALANGDFVVVWRDNSLGVGGATGDPDTGVKGQLFDASGARIGSEFLVNTTTAGDQQQPEVLALSGGGFAVTWWDGFARLQVFDSSGGKVGSELAFSSSGAIAGSQSDIAELSNGDIAVVWQEFGTTGDNDNNAIVSQIVTAAGVKSGGTLLVNQVTANNQQNPQVVALTGGGFAVAWDDPSDFAATGYNVRYRVVSATNTAVSNEATANTATAGDQMNPEMIPLANGGFFILWKQGSSNADIYGQLFTSTGAKSGSETLLSTATAGSQFLESAVQLSDGNIAVAWADGSAGVGGTGGDFSGYAVKAQVFTSSLVKVGSEILVNTTTSGDQLSPAIVALANGGFAIAFRDDSASGGDTSSSAIRMQAFNSDGAKNGGEILVNTATAGAQLSPVMADLGGHRFVVVWNDGSQGVGGATGDTSAFAVKGQVFNIVGATPTVATQGGAVAYTESTAASPASPAAVDAGITVSDADSSALPSATVAITGNFSTGDVLAFANDGSTMGNVVGSYNSSTGVLALTSAGGTATLAQWQAALRAVTYSTTSDAPSELARTISFTVSDGETTSTAATRTVNVTAANDGPVLAGSLTTQAYTEGTPTAVAPGITVADPDSPSLGSATLSIVGGFHPGQDVLVFTNAGATMGDIGGSYNSATGVLTLTSAGGAATLAHWQAALRSVAYDNSSDTPDTSNRVVSVTISDGALSATVSPTVTVAAVDDAPSLGGAGGTTAFTEGAPAAVAPALTVADPDSTTLASATVAITGNFHAAEDVLAFTNSSSTIFGNVVGSYNSGTGVLTLTSSGATATLAQWQAALRAVTYADGSDTPNTAARVISFTANDGTASSSAPTQTVTVTGVDDAPTLGGAGGTTAFTEGAAVAVASGLTVADADNTSLTSATVSVTGGFHAGQDVLAFVNDGSTMGNVVASYNAATGVLALNSSGGTATLAQWQAALRAVTYNNSSDAPDLASRTLSFVVSDGMASATAATQTVTVTGVNDAPAGANATVSIQQGTTKVFAATDFGFTDVDGGTLAGVKIATLPLTGALTDNGVAVTAGQVVSAADVAGGKLVFTPMAGATGSAYASFTFQVQDNGGVANGGVDLDPTPNTLTIDVHAPIVSPPPPPPPPSGTAGPDVIVLDGSVATLFAGEGADTVTGSFASETIDGGPGDDAIHGGGGDDEIIGGSGSNYLRGDAGDDVIRGGDGFDDAHGNMGNDTVSGGGGDDWVVGGKDDDVLHGDEGGDVVYGNLGDDTLDGGPGADVLRGGQGADLLEGGAGNDFLAGDRGDDTLTGGGGADVFHAWAGAGIDRVTDFNAAEGDRVEVLAGDAYTVSQVGADVQIAFADGSRMVLAGVQLTTLPSGWIFSA